MIEIFSLQFPIVAILLTYYLKMKGVKDMPRGRRRESDYKTTLALLDEQINSCNESLEKTKAKKKALMDERKKVVTDALYRTLSVRELSVEEAIEILNDPSEAKAR